MEELVSVKNAPELDMLAIMGIQLKREKVIMQPSLEHSTNALL